MAWPLHDDALARAAHGAPPRRVYPLLALALRAVLAVGGDVDARARAVVVVAARVAPGDLVLAPILDDVACAHVLEDWICRQAGADFDADQVRQMGAMAESAAHS